MEELDNYDYQLPPELIAQAPATPRDAARLLIYERQSGQTKLATFVDLPEYLPANSIVVFNQTKVIPARLTLNRSSGGKVSILYLKRIGGQLEVLANRRLKMGEELFHHEEKFFTVNEAVGNHYLLDANFDLAEVEAVFERWGETPLPPYMKQSPLSEVERREQYQTVFAKEAGSVAAPTASLHFTPELLLRLAAKGIQIEYVTLHVGLGTFAPLKPDHFASGELHEEFFTITPDTQERLRAARLAGRKIIAVGTTTARVLESDWQAVSTKIFIRPGYEFKFVSGLVTNFHVPRSSLLMLVATLVGREKLLALYQEAISQKFRFYSFGDGMLVL